MQARSPLNIIGIKGYLKVEDNECLRTTEEVAEVFGTKAKHRGFLRASGAVVAQQEARNSLVAEYGTPPLAQRTLGGWNVYLRISERRRTNVRHI